MNLETVWITHPLNDVLRFYADAFEAKDGREIFMREYFVDTTKNVVVFKITTQDKP